MGHSNIRHNNITMNTDPYKKALNEALYFKDMNIKWMNRDSRYNSSKPTIWLQLLGLFETLEIIQVSQNYIINNHDQ